MLCCHSPNFLLHLPSTFLPAFRHQHLNLVENKPQYAEFRTKQSLIYCLIKVLTSEISAFCNKFRKQFVVL